MGFVLKTTSHWQGTQMTHDLSDFGMTEDDARELYNRFKNGGMTSEEMDEFHQQACEDQGIEWWIEEE